MAGAVGAHFSVEATPTQPSTDYLVVGVVADSRYLSSREERAPSAYFAASQDPSPGNGALLAARGRVAPTAMTASMVQSFRELNPGIGVSFTMLDKFIDHTLVLERLMATLSSFFGSIAVALAVMGCERGHRLYGDASNQ